MVKWIVLVIASWTLSAHAMTDPTLPLALKQAKKPTTHVKRVASAPLPSLQVITCMENQACTATLNGRIVKAGQEYRGYRVVKIREDRVVLARQNRQWVLDLFGQKIKQ